MTSDSRLNSLSSTINKETLEKFDKISNFSKCKCENHQRYLCVLFHHYSGFDIFFTIKPEVILFTILCEGGFSEVDDSPKFMASFNSAVKRLIPHYLDSKNVEEFSIRAKTDAELISAIINVYPEALSWIYKWSSTTLRALSPEIIVKDERNADRVDVIYRNVMLLCFDFKYSDVAGYLNECYDEIGSLGYMTEVIEAIPRDHLTKILFSECLSVPLLDDYADDIWKIVFRKEYDHTLFPKNYFGSVGAIKETAKLSVFGTIFVSSLDMWYEEEEEEEEEIE